jgi:FKBP-type peptidyl-prolyl cis-trans isomerase SlyD
VFYIKHRYSPRQGSQQYNYTFTNAQGQALDATGAEPFSYLHGHRNIISGLEKALDGRNQGDAFKIHIPATDAYGERSEKLITTVPLDRFNGADSVQAGMQFHAETSDGELQMVAVPAVERDTITIDGNHPMAGLDLNFDVSVVGIREASEEELQHGLYGEKPLPPGSIQAELPSL